MTTSRVKKLAAVAALAAIPAFGLIGTSPASAAPAGYLQQVGVPAIGGCAAVSEPSLNLAGVAYGGWGLSWARWINNGAGGPVCSRVLVHDASAADWYAQ
ncbi:MAG: hypothetical protein Q8L05_06410 [Actinomycetota bacterium]|nr:hypothetical protein [Actinomycetota bacterium]MDP2289421.1 hypothetical protein [Actinomycetota bacterium]